MSKNSNSRYIVGIDLGTTNSAVSYFDRLNPDLGVQKFLIKQWKDENLIVETNMLPSFCYVPLKNELKKNTFQFEEFQCDDITENPLVVGEISRDYSVTRNQRVINSAKSWLCHSGVDRQEKILPWHSDEIIGNNRFSPVEASAAILRHIKQNWNFAMASISEEYKLENQFVTITVPASFDELSQHLTIKAAESAGYHRKNLKLIEEPQAAFYHWFYTQMQNSNEFIDFVLSSPNRERIVLICDIGGGTTDFSLFSVSFLENKKIPLVNRIKVGDHLLLGGDNIDLQIAHFMESQLGKTLTSQQWNQLVSQSRMLKEKVLTEGFQNEESELYVSIASSGSSLFQSTLTASISVEKLKELIIDGFFPDCRQNDRPEVKSNAVMEWGLNYPIDTAITKHLAQFLDQTKVDAILVNGGCLKPKFIQEKILNLLDSWQGEKVRLLENIEMDLAVSLGATSQSVLNESQDVEIKNGYPRSLYIAVAGHDGMMKLLSIIPKGFDSRDTIKFHDIDIKARVNETSSFYLFYSNTRTDLPGTFIPFQDSEVKSLPPLQTTLKFDNKKQKNIPNSIAIGLEAKIEDTGLLQLNCYSKENVDQVWTLNFNTVLKSTDIVDFQQLKQNNKSHTQILEHQKTFADNVLETFFGKKIIIPNLNNPNQLSKLLEKEFSLDKKEWDLQTIRDMWPKLHEGINRRGRSSNHEMAWLNFAGFLLRPGFGFEKDESYVQSLWDVYNLGMIFPNESKVKDQWWIMWRRVAGGLSHEQQTKIFNKIFPTLKKVKEATPEMYMLAGALEKISVDYKIQLGNALVEQIIEGKSNGLDQRIWALSKLASRRLLSGSMNYIIRPNIIENWFDKLSHLNFSKKPYGKLTMFLIQGGRRLNNRELDISEKYKNQFIHKLKNSGASEEKINILLEVTELNQESQEELFGEQLPLGFIL